MKRVPGMVRAAVRNSTLMLFVLGMTRGCVGFSASNRLAFVSKKELARLAPSSQRNRGRNFSHLRDTSPGREYSKEAALAREAFAVLARNGRSWRRLGHLVDMAVEESNDGLLKQPVRSIADIGCDHGLLTVGLAVSGAFEKVLGVDVSERALQDGAISLQRRVLSYVHDDVSMGKNGVLPSLALSATFREGDGLSVVNPGEADAVCIAGMGSQSMLQILQSSSDEILDVERVGCRKLFLQPTNSKPRYLMMLYDALGETGWCLMDERIEKVSSRWYISSSFSKRDALVMAEESVQSFPGAKLLQPDSSKLMRREFSEYVKHHESWIRQDGKAAGGRVGEEDTRWLEYIRSE
jgi:tRNA A22 N-methylase